MRVPFSFQVEEFEARLDLYLQTQTGESRTYVQEQIRAGVVKINGAPAKKPSQKVRQGDHIEGHFLSAPPSELTAVEHPLNVLWEDEYLLALNKDQGTVVHPAVGHREETLVHYLLHYLQQHGPFKEFGTERPGIVHRLDRGTSGVILVAKDRKTQDKLQRLFKAREMKKEYEAIVWGTPPLEGQFLSVIGRDQRDRKKMSSKTSAGREALTSYKRAATYKHFSHMVLFPKTGRTHQLRVHLTEAGFPIVGDPLYGERSLSKRGGKLAVPLVDFLKKIEMTFLHARSLTFPHPVTKEILALEAKRPEIFDKFLNLLRNSDA